jgi:DNA-binding NarL/FixJ family response regulator
LFVILFEVSVKKALRPVSLSRVWPNFFSHHDMTNAPVFIVDGDIDDKELLAEAWRELALPNQLYFFKNAEEVIWQLETNSAVPFLIISEINLPKTSGLELKKYLLEHNDTNFKSIPFVFLSDTPSQAQIEDAYYFCTNGLFKKSGSFDKLKQQLIDIVKYWRESLVPIN